MGRGAVGRAVWVESSSSERKGASALELTARISVASLQPFGLSQDGGRKRTVISA